MMTSYILDTVRTPRGRGKAGTGALSGVPPRELLAPLLPALAERNEIDPAHLVDLVVGAVSQVGEQGANLAQRGARVGAYVKTHIATALDEDERRNEQTALVTMCIGGGQGIAMILERL